MERSNVGEAPSVDRVLSPPALQELPRLSKWDQKPLRVVNAEARAITSTDTDTQACRSKRIAQRQTSSNSPLFTLPTEIRDRILHYALLGVCVRFYHANTNVGAMYGFRIGIDFNHWNRLSIE
jgi:hypothetical protein